MPDDETTALLIRARGFIERGWSRGTYARDANGSIVPPHSPKAVCWCAVGALIAVGVHTPHPARNRLLAAIRTGESLSTFNDRQETVEPVLAAFDRAIAAGASS